MYLLLTFKPEHKLRKVTDYNQVPLGTNHFGAKHRIGFSKELKHTKPVLPTPVTNPDMSVVPTIPANQPPFDGHPSQYYYPPHMNPLQHRYSYPYHPLVPYGSHYAPGFAPSNPAAFPPAAPLSLQSDHVQLGDSSHGRDGTVRNQAIVPETLTQSLSVPQMAVKAFCDKYELGDEEREGLRKLGFRVGDALDTVTENEWVISGLAPLHRRRVLSAWNTEYSVDS